MANVPVLAPDDQLRRNIKYFPCFAWNYPKFQAELGPEQTQIICSAGCLRRLHSEHRNGEVYKTKFLEFWVRAESDPYFDINL